MTSTLKTTLLFLFISLSTAFSQVDSMYVSTSMNVEINSIDYTNSRLRLMEYIQSNSLKIYNQFETKRSINLTFNVDETQFNKIDELLIKLGYTSSKKITTINNFNKVKEIELELKYLRDKQQSFKELISKINDTSENYYSFWRDLKSIEEQIFKSEKDLLVFNNEDNSYMITLNLKEEDTTPYETKVTFVNMPGVEFSYLNIETPAEGISSRAYKGYFVKYLVTKGKTYLLAGAYKEANTTTIDTARISEMFILGFGQDFYTRHFGKGTRKFLNLYSGYSMGGLIATNNTSKSNNFFIAPSVGVELFKNKYILFDTKASYFIPFQNNRNLRGISYNASFNFVF